MEVPRLGVESELQLPATATATAMQDPSRIYDLHHSSWQHQILNPLSKARDRTHILMDTSWVLLSHNGNSASNSLNTEKVESSDLQGGQSPVNFSYFQLRIQKDYILRINMKPKWKKTIRRTETIFESAQPQVGWGRSSLNLVANHKEGNSLWKKSIIKNFKLPLERSKYLANKRKKRTMEADLQILYLLYIVLEVIINISRTIHDKMD